MGLKPTIYRTQGEHANHRCSILTKDIVSTDGKTNMFLIVLNAAFSNISAISWSPVLVVEEAGVPVENHRQATGKLYHLWMQVKCIIFCNLQARARTHVIYGDRNQHHNTVA